MSLEGSLPVRFADGKAPDAMRTIGEVAEAFGLKTHILRYWEEHFDRLRPLKRGGGRRLYRPEDVALVARIDRMVNKEGYTLKGARAALEQSRGDTPGNNAVEQSVGSVDAAQLVAGLKQIRVRLASALDA